MQNQIAHEIHFRIFPSEASSLPAYDTGSFYSITFDVEANDTADNRSIVPKQFETTRLVYHKTREYILKLFSDLLLIEMLCHLLIILIA